MLILALYACGPTDVKYPDDVACEPGTHQEDGACVADEVSDTDTDTDSDTDSDTDADADSDTDADTDTDPSADADGDGYTPAQGDCDDADAEVSPGATEACGNGKDDDCDGTPGDCAWSGATRLPDGGWELQGDRAYEYAGVSVSAGGDVDGDGIGDLLVGSERSAAGEEAGATYVVRGPVDADRALLDAVTILNGDGDGAYAGETVAFVGDTDGDGVDDFVVGAPTQAFEVSPRGRGTVYVVRAPAAGEADVADAGTAWTGETSTSGAGSSAAAAGDLNDDGLADVVVGAYEDGSYAQNAGAAYVLFGPADAGGDLGGADVRIYGRPRYNYENLGSSVRGLGDVDGDGVDDLAVGAQKYSAPDQEGTYAGAIHIFFGPLSGALTSEDDDARIHSSDCFTAPYLGHVPGALGAAGDVDGDGLADVIVGNEYVGSGTSSSFAGAVYLVGGAALTGDVETFFADWSITGEEAAAQLGWAATGVGDEDGDGFADVVVSAASDGAYGSHAGATFLFRGPLSGEASIGDADATFYGGGEGWYAGWQLAAGDVTGDDWPDLVVGAPGASSSADSSGSVFVLPGGGF